MQHELKAARKALKHSLKELDTAEADKTHLQRQVNKLSRTLQVRCYRLQHHLKCRASFVGYATKHCYTEVHCRSQKHHQVLSIGKLHM